MADYTETKTRLIINKLSREKYDELYQNDLINQNELYLVEDTNLDALSARLLNVGDPVSATDGTNKQYVDGLIDSITTVINTKAASADIFNQEGKIKTDLVVTGSIADGAVTEAKLAKFTEWSAAPGAPAGYWFFIQFSPPSHAGASDGSWAVWLLPETAPGPTGGPDWYEDNCTGDETVLYPTLNDVSYTLTRHPLATKKTSDLENDGEDGTSPYITKAVAEAGWWSEWTILRTLHGVTTDVTHQVVQPKWSDGNWDISQSVISPDIYDVPTEGYFDHEADKLSWDGETPNPEGGDDYGVYYTATRHLVCAPVPTNPEDIGAADATSVSARFDTVVGTIESTSGLLIGNIASVSGALESSITRNINTHDQTASAHQNIQLSTTNITSGVFVYDFLPSATTETPGIIMPDDVTITVTDGVLSATSALATYENLSSVSGELSSSVDGKLNSTAGAPDFQTSATYFVNEYVNKDGNLYRCTSAVTTSGNWNAAHWEETDMTTPDATLDITNQGALRVVGADGTILWMQGYTLATSSTSALSNATVNRFDFTNNVTSASLVLPTAPAGKVGDFVLDVLNTATTSANFEIAGLDSNVVVVIPAGENLIDMMTFESSAMSELYFTTTSFAISGIPTWKIVRQDLEDGGASWYPECLTMRR